MPAVRIRPYLPADEEAIVALSLRAWAPAAESMEQVLGAGLFRRLRGVFQASQAAVVRDGLHDEHNTSWVAERGDEIAGFAIAVIHPGAMGGLDFLAVDPAHQRRGVARALIDTVMDWCREQSADVLMIETGGDAGHAPARAAYRSAGFTEMPIARYFRQL